MNDYLYWKILNDIIEFLKQYKFVEQEAGDKISRLYILDRKAISYLKNMEKELFIEYSNDSSFYKKHNLSNIIKVINFEKPAHSFRTYTAYHWREINDQEKVFSNLDKELEKSFNKQIANVKKELKKKNISNEVSNQTIYRIKQEYEIAKKEVEFLKNNKDRVIVRISEYKRRRLYPRVDFIIEKQRQNAINLKTTALNGIWFEELNEDKKRNSNNELVEFLQKAKNPFGDVYYIMKETKDNE